MSTERQYENFLESRRQETSNFLWISRNWEPTIAFQQGKKRPSPNSHKEAVLKSPKIQELLEQISIKEDIPKSALEIQVHAVLDEIGYEKKIKVIRWLGFVLTKICLKVLNGIYVNKEQVLKIRNDMGSCPVIFVPTHRSYGDFIMMSYITFNYDIELPAIAAGMDFHGMWGMGTLLRDTGAFFMRRSYNNDSLYWTTFRQYVYQLVSKGDLPMEFFIEGTRSRSNKSMSPKYGLLTMVLKAFFLAQVPDIMFVPIGISYDRILEESLFAFELLGVPKPKESTSGFFKSMKILKEKFGNIYVHMDEPISAKQFFGDKLDRSVHSLGPVHQQEITDDEKKLLPPLAFEILKRQQNSLVLTVFNLIAVILNNNLSYATVPLTVNELIQEVAWFKSIVDILGAFTHCENVDSSVKESLTIHNNLIYVNKERKLRLIRNKVNQQEINPKKLKGHALSDKMMTRSVPFVMLQIYSNPVLHYLIDLNIVLLILRVKPTSRDQLFDNYYFLRSLFSREFIIFSAKDQMIFNTTLDKAISLNLITEIDGYYQLGNNKKLEEFIVNAFMTFSLSYDAVLFVLQNLPDIIDEKSILSSTQKLLEEAIKENNNVHPYSLNLDTLVNCLSSLCDLGVVKKSRRNDKNMYEKNRDKLNLIKENFEKFIPQYVLRISPNGVRDQLQNKL